MSTVPGVADIHHALLERINTGEFGIGERLPSVRDLASLLGSNPSTVDRAVRRLSEAGVVRTVPRKGTYVTSTGTAVGDQAERLEEDLDRLLGRARAAGMSTEEIRGTFDRAMERFRRQPRVAFVECNPDDLERMARMVRNATEVELVPLLLEDIAAGLDGVDAVATPLFHLAEVAALGVDPALIVELNFLPSAAALRRMATLAPWSRVAVSSPTERGLHRFAAMVTQYYSGEVEFLPPEEATPERMAGIDMLVHSSASGLPPELTALAGEEILIEWELDPVSAASFRARIAEVAGAP